MSSISSLPPFMVRGVVDWCVTVSSLGDDDIVLVRLVLIMVTEYDLYLGGAALRPCDEDTVAFGVAALRSWCLQPWRVRYPFIPFRTRNSEPNSFTKGFVDYGFVTYGSLNLVSVGFTTEPNNKHLHMVSSYGSPVANMFKGSPRIGSSGFGGLHQTLNCSSSLQEGIKVMVICLRRISYSKLPKLKLMVGPRSAARRLVDVVVVDGGMGA
ncbi:hypothetical protein Tco_0398234 [Tanacetum coccineum]